MRWLLVAFLASICLLAPVSSSAVPRVGVQGGAVTVAGDGYRARFVPESAGFQLDVRGANGNWQPVAVDAAGTSLALFDGQEHSAGARRATWAFWRAGDDVVVGQQLVLDVRRKLVLNIDCCCTNRGLLLGTRLTGPPSGDRTGWLWSPPRFRLDTQRWTEYRFWDGESRAHEGRINALDPCPAYAGISPWEQRGDTVAAFDAHRPALIVRPADGATSLAVVYIDYATRWREAKMFVQRHQPDAVFLYSGYAPADAAGEPLWAYLAALPSGDVGTMAEQVAALAREGADRAAAFQSIAPPVPNGWLTELPDFPKELRRSEPVRDINEAVVFTINETTSSEGALRGARKVGSDVLIRGWFKWRNAPPVSQWAKIPSAVHEIGGLFGGGITCSALYDDENGITRQQLLDMATRGPAGQLLDAWDTAGIRHGSLSSPAYRDYLFGWCRQQIDAGVDYLFMDEHTAALAGLEGYDDHSLADFRRYLLTACPQTQDWAADDARWTSDCGIELANRQICPDGTMRTFEYRAFLQAKRWLEKPNSGDHPLAALWSAFRSWRDDAAWKEITDRIREYARQRRRKVLISANGIARYVDLQVLGVWGQWRTRDGHIDLSESQLPVWRSIVRRGQQVAGKPMPVVLFHDWGFGDPPFPWLAVRPSERELWMRTRGAEIYAAGGFFAFPVLGPFGCNAEHDGTLGVIQRLTAFYQRHRELLLRSRYVGSERLAASSPDLSLAAWWSDEPPRLILHAVNRRVAQRTGHDAVQLEPQTDVTIRVPAVARLPEAATAVSPDWEGELRVNCRTAGDGIEFTLPRLEASAMIVARWADQAAALLDVSRLKDPVRVVPVPMWCRPTRNEFPVQSEGTIVGEDQLNGFLQGRLHQHLRNPPTFLVDAVEPGCLLVKVRAVASGGAKLVWSVDGQPQKTVNLPDRDGENDGSAAEYDQVVELPIPAGRHRLTLDNQGADWLTIGYFQFDGRWAE